MKLVAIPALFMCASAFSQPVQEVGMHLFSRHDPYRGENQVNQGVFVRFQYGLTAGTYVNSFRRTSHYVGWATPEWHRMRLSILAVSGYRDRSILLPIPSVKLYQVDNGPSIWLSGMPIQVTDSRAVGHIHVEWSFK